jgi:hypothetical protein
MNWFPAAIMAVFLYDLVPCPSKYNIVKFYKWLQIHTI